LQPLASPAAHRRTTPTTPTRRPQQSTPSGRTAPSPTSRPSGSPTPRAHRSWS